MADDPIAEFKPDTVLKRDVLSETWAGTWRGQRAALRRLDRVPVWARPVAQWLARREARALAAVQGIDGVPVLVAADRRGILRLWSEGTPLHLGPPEGAAYWHQAKRLLRQMRRRGVTHNDSAKAQNWLVTPAGGVALLDFQLAALSRRRGALHRILAREDLRHLLKQKRAFAKALLTSAERRLLARKSLPNRIWMATGKRLYNLVTRRLMGWADREGAGSRPDREGPRIAALLQAGGAVGEVAVCAYPLPSRGVGLYVFAETALAAPALRALVPGAGPDLYQPVAALPRDAAGAVRRDILGLVAANRHDEVRALIARDPGLAPVLEPILAGRLNLGDRRLRDASP